MRLYFFIRFSLCQFPTFKCQILSQFYCQKFLIRVSNFDSILKQIDCFFNQRSIYHFASGCFISPRQPVIACGSESARDLEKREKIFCLLLFIFVVYKNCHVWSSCLFCEIRFILILSLSLQGPALPLKLTKSQKYFLFSIRSEFRFSGVQLK